MYREKAFDLPQVIDKHYHTMLYRLSKKTIDLSHVTDTLYYIILHRAAGENY